MGQVEEGESRQVIMIRSALSLCEISEYILVTLYPIRSKKCSPFSDNLSPPLVVFLSRPSHTFSVRNFLTHLKHFLQQVGECQRRPWDDEEVENCSYPSFIRIPVLILVPTKSMHLQIYLDMTALRHRKDEERSNVQRASRQVFLLASSRQLKCYKCNTYIEQILIF